MDIIFRIFKIVLLFLSATGVQAQEDDWYVAAGVGLSFQSNSDNIFIPPGGVPDDFTFSFERGELVTGAIGKYFNNFRVEGEIFHIVSDLDENTNDGFTVNNIGDVSFLGFMANAYFDYQTNTNFTPYLGVGIGFVKAHINQPGDHSHEHAYAYQLKTGVGYQFNSSLDFILGYRYIGTDDGHFDVRDGELEVESQEIHNIEVGIRYRF